MSAGWFQFKQFMVRQDEPVFRVGTDGVLLGAWTDVNGVDSVLDIGTGTGLLALMMAQRTHALITAVEMDEASCRQAVINFEASPWKERIQLHCSDIREFRSGSVYDLLICNPPFFQDSKLPGRRSLSFSKHNVNMGLADLASLVPRLLDRQGRFCTVLPPAEASRLTGMMQVEGWDIKRTMNIRPRPGLPVKRLLLEYRHGRSADPLTEEIAIENKGRHDYTLEYKRLTQDFYLAF
jgi:tRNA1Val (adenine37-N6)-methyltransferase